MKLACLVFFFSFSLNLSFTQIWEKYSFSKELEERYQQDPGEAFAASIAYDEYLIGEYQKALEYHDLYASQRVINAKEDSLLSTFKQLPATEELLKRTSNEQIIVLDYVPYMPSQKHYLTTLLPELRKQGFRFLGLDGLYHLFEDTLMKTSMFLTEDLQKDEMNDFYFRELVKQAQALGFTIFSINKLYAEGRNSMEEQADVVRKFLAKNPNEKAVVLAAPGQLQKKEMDSLHYTITSLLIDNELRPFTVSLTNFLERHATNLEPSFLASIKEPIYFMTDSSEFKGWTKEKQVDMNIALPKWINTTTNRPAPNFFVPHKRFISYPAFVMVFQQSEFKKYEANDLIPIEIKEVHSEDEAVSFYLPKGEYTILFTYQDRSINHTLNVIMTK